MEIRYDSIPLDPAFPFNAESMDIPANDDMGGAYHWHDCFEISAVTGGSGTYIIDRKSYPVFAGDTVIINNIEPHQLIAGGEGLRQTLIVFGPSLVWSGGNNRLDMEYILPMLDHPAEFNNLISGAGSLSEETRPLIGEILREYTQKRRGWQMMIRARLLTLLAYLYRFHYNPHALSENRHDLCRLYGVFVYIEQNFKFGVSLREAAKIAGMTPTYFSTVFKRAVSVSFIDYVIKTKINCAVSLLCTTTMPVAQAAMESGFGNIANFNAAFKKHTGKTPTEYRQSN